MINKLNKLDDEQDLCPECLGDNIANEGPENSDGTIDMTCHDCSYQWGCLNSDTNVKVQK